MAHGNGEIFKSVCSYCGVGCGIEILKGRDGELELRGDAGHPANRGLLCSKGRSLLHTVRARETRLHFPTMRLSRGAARERVGWDQAMGHVAEKFRQIIQEHGPDAVAFYISGQCLTEEYYLANKIAKGFLKTNNIDTNSRLCMSSAVCGYKATLGADGPPVCYDDIDLCDTFLVAGANVAWCHPVLFRRIEARQAADADVKLIVVDPRRTATAVGADLHLQIRPGTDVALFLGLARQLAQTGRVDKEFMANHVEGAEVFLESAQPWTLARTAEVTGVTEKQISQAAEWLGGKRRLLSMWTMGLNQSAVGTDKNIALIALSLITGKIGKPGCGPFSLTGQPNAMGGREVGGMATLLSAHRDLASAEDRAEVARFWGVNALPEKVGLTAVEMFDAIAAGKVKAVWIIATNPVATLPASWNAEAALQKAELVVVQDIYPTETSDLADVVLPAAGWLEKTGTMTNSDRRISLLEKAIEPPGDALADTEILIRFARTMGWEKAFGYLTSAEVFAEHAALTAGTDIDITGLNYARLKSQGSAQWPVPVGKHDGTPRLYTDHQFATENRKARLQAMAFEDRSEPLTAEFPLVLTTGRIRDQWHTMTKTGQVNKLNTHIDSPFCEIHPEDAVARGIAEGDIVTVAGARGEVRVRAVVTADIREGVVFLPMHWGKKLGGERGRANNVTSPRLDPVSKEPDLKYAAVEVKKYVPAKRRILIVGAGAAALAFVERHRAYNQQDEIVLLGGENFPVYNRVMLPHYMDGSKPWEALVRADRDVLGPHQVAFHSNTLVVRVDRRNRIVTDAGGREFSYDALILATGSRAAVHYDGPLPKAGVYTLRSRAHADAIMAEAAAGKRVVIHGGGLLGLEVADALQRRGCRVTIVQRSDRLMGKQLDETAAEYLAEEVKSRGIEICFDAQLMEAMGEDHVTAVRLAQRELAKHTEDELVEWVMQERELACDLLIFATGIVPNKEVGGAAGIDCDRGILVNRFLQTSDPNIFAIGECAEFEGQTFGTTPAAEEQAAVLAEYFRGNEHSPYKMTTTANVLKMHGLTLAAAGKTEPLPEEDVEVVVMSDRKKRYYQKCVIQNDRLIGAICMGDMARFGEYLRLIGTGMELEDLRATLLRPGGGGAALDGALVCSCNHVGAGTIAKAGAEWKGDVMKVCAATRAGMGCGSCRPEVVKLVKNAVGRVTLGVGRT